MHPIDKYIRTIPDFPEEGIMFRDITTVTQDPEGFKLAVDSMQDLIKDLDYDVMVGVEARGFIFGAAIAYNMGKGLSLIRKMENKPSDQRVLSSYILTCFISIDEPTTQKLLLSQTSNKLDLTKDEISKLTDMYQIEKKYTEDQIMDFSKALNTAFEKIKNAQSGGMRPPSQGG